MAPSLLQIAMVCGRIPLVKDQAVREEKKPVVAKAPLAAPALARPHARDCEASWESSLIVRLGIRMRALRRMNKCASMMCASYMRAARTTNGNTLIVWGDEIDADVDAEDEDERGYVLW
jgi:hypothetical protein